MSNVLVIGGSATVRTMLRQKLGALVSAASAADQDWSWRSWWATGHTRYENTTMHAQMGWVNAINKEVRTQQSRKAHQVRRLASRRQAAPQLRKTRVKGITIAR